MLKPIMAGIAALLIAGPALAAEEWDFILVNNSSKPIKLVEVSPAGKASWVANKIDPEIKRDDVLRPEGRMTVHFEKEDAECRYDLRATFEDGSDSVWPAINVCDNSFVTISYAANGTTRFTAN